MLELSSATLKPKTTRVAATSPAVATHNGCAPDSAEPTAIAAASAAA
jgi:hypothetical protein